MLISFIITDAGSRGDLCGWMVHRDAMHIHRLEPLNKYTEWTQNQLKKNLNQFIFLKTNKIFEIAF